MIDPMEARVEDMNAEALGIPGSQLMEIAGKLAAEEIMKGTDPDRFSMAADREVWTTTYWPMAGKAGNIDGSKKSNLSLGLISKKCIPSRASGINNFGGCVFSYFSKSDQRFQEDISSIPIQSICDFCCFVREFILKKSDQQLCQPTMIGLKSALSKRFFYCLRIFGWISDE